MTQRSYNRTLVDNVTHANAFSTDSIDMNHMSGLNVSVAWTKNTPDATDFATTDVDTDEDTITETAHGYVTGLLGQFTTTTTLPAGLSLATNYYLIYVDDDTYAVATSQANATAGTKVNITDQGTGTHTFTATDTLAGTVDVQGSNDNSTFLDVLDSSGDAIEQTIGDSSSAYTFNLSNFNARYARVDFTLTSGQGEITVKANAKGGAS